MTNEESKQIGLELKPEVAKGAYSNLAVISHSKTEFIIDFAEILPGFPKPEVVSRIVMSPEHTKRLMAAIIDNIKKYESQFGPIELGEKNTLNIADFVNGTKS